jgi:hypothetical protein
MILGYKTPYPQVARSRDPKNVDEWLAIATEDLMPSAQARVRAEITGHYSASVLAHAQAGESAPAADAAALAELGNPWVSSGRFARAYLTRQDAGNIAAMARHSVWTWITLGLVAFMPIFWHLLGFVPGEHGNSFLMCYYVIAMSGMGRNNKEADLPASLDIERFARLLLRQGIMIFIVCMVWVGLGCADFVASRHDMRAGIELLYMTSIVLLYLMFSCVTLLGLRKKLLQYAKDDFAPSGPAEN